jgi:tripartite-type tricarboxylate transporter receptor subunit TctC
MQRRVVERIHRGMQEVIAMPDVATRIHDLGAIPHGSSPEDFRNRSEREIARFKTIVAARRIPME